MHKRYPKQVQHLIDMETSSYNKVVEVVLMEDSALAWGKFLYFQKLTLVSIHESVLHA